LLRRVLVPIGMSIWTVAGDIIDFLRPATDAMTDSEEKRGQGEREEGHLDGDGEGEEGRGRGRERDG